MWGQRLPNGSWNGLVGMLGSGAADIGIANLFITSLMGRRDYQHFSSPFHQAVSILFVHSAYVYDISKLLQFTIL